MVKVYCDMCLREIDYEKDGVNMDFNSFGTVRFKQGQDLEKQLCRRCAQRVCDYIDAEALKVSADMQEGKK